MTDSDTSRTVAAPPARKRTMDASRLLASNREADFLASAVQHPEPQRPAFIPPAEVPVAEVPATVTAPQEANQKPKRRPNLTIDIEPDLRARVRAVYKATHDREGEDTFQGMIWKVLEDLCIRREQYYNNGQRFDGGDEAFRRGRPIR